MTIGDTGGKSVQIRGDEGGASRATDGSSLGSSAGHRFAKTVTSGGTGTAFAGHGKYVFGSGDIIVPRGTAITLPKVNISISDKTGQYIETGNWEGLAKAALKNAKIKKDIEGMATYLSGEKVPNYTLTAPINPSLNIFRNSITVDSSTSLEKLLEPNIGYVQWAACTVYTKY